LRTKKQSIVELGAWLQTDVGRYVQKWEQARIDSLVADMFGDHALQLGLPQLNLLQANRMPHKVWAGNEAVELFGQASSGNVLRCYPEYLPFDSQSIDLLVLPHVLERSVAPHQVLREVERVLVPEGRVVISGFNPWSLWGLRQRIPYMAPWLPYPKREDVSLVRLKDWLKLLSFDIDRGHFGCYAPPCRTEKWLSRYSFMEHAGDRWWPICGAVFVVSAVKRVAGMRLIKPTWTKKYRRRSMGQASGVAMHGSSEAVKHD
jgi:SAM-dependent methyltransferase